MHEVSFDFLTNPEWLLSPYICLEIQVTDPVIHPRLLSIMSQLASMGVNCLLPELMDFCFVYQNASPAMSLFLCCLSFLNLPVHDWRVIIVLTWPIRLWKLWVASSGLLYNDCCLAVKVAPTKCIFQASMSSFSTAVWRCCLMGWNTAWGCSPHIGQEKILEDTSNFTFS